MYEGAHTLILSYMGLEARSNYSLKFIVCRVSYNITYQDAHVINLIESKGIFFRPVISWRFLGRFDCGHYHWQRQLQ